MIAFFKKPYALLWLFIISFIAYRELSLSTDNIVYNHYDTYYVIAKRHYTILLAIVLFIISLVYLFSEKLNIRLHSKLTSIHLVFTITPIVAYPLIKLYVNYKCGEFPLYDYCYDLDNYSEISAVLFLMAQLLLVINFLIGIFKVLQRKVK